MADDVSLRIVGARELAAALERLPDKVARTVQQTGLRRGATNLRRSLRAAAPRGPTGQLAKSIRYRTIRRGRGSGTIGYKVYAAGVHKTLPRSFIWNAALLRMFEEGGAPRKPVFPRRAFFDRTVRSQERPTLDIIVQAMQDAISYHAGRELARAQRLSGRAR
jgi:hypothetical protein